MSRVEWAAAATRDLTRIGTYLAQFGDGTSASEISRLVLATGWLLANPHGGPEIGYRDWRKWKPRGARHVLIYRRVSGGIRIVRVRHERQNWQPTS